MTTQRSSHEKSAAKLKSRQRESTAEPIDSPNDWVDAHGDSLYRFAMKKLNNDAVAEDLIQETLLAALKSYDRFKGDCSLRTWLTAILRRKISDHFRLQSRERVTNDYPEQTRQGPATFRAERLVAWNQDPADLVEDSEFWGVFRNCKSKLPDLLSDAFELRTVEGLSVKSICEILQINSNNLALRLYRARSLLRECLDKSWFQGQHRSARKAAPSKAKTMQTRSIEPTLPPNHRMTSERVGLPKKDQGVH